MHANQSEKEQNILGQVWDSKDRAKSLVLGILPLSDSFLTPWLKEMIGNYDRKYEWKWSKEGKTGVKDTMFIYTYKKWCRILMKTSLSVAAVGADSAEE